MSSNRSLTRSQARRLLSIARLKMTRSHLDRAISRRTRMDQTCFGSRGFLWPMSNPLFQGRWPRSTELAGIEGRPPPRPPRRSIASGSFIPTEQSGFPKKILATDHFWREVAAREHRVVEEAPAAAAGAANARGVGMPASPPPPLACAAGGASDLQVSKLASKWAIEIENKQASKSAD